MEEVPMEKAPMEEDPDDVPRAFGVGAEPAQRNGGGPPPAGVPGAPGAGRAQVDEISPLISSAAATTRRAKSASRASS